MLVEDPQENEIDLTKVAGWWLPAKAEGEAEDEMLAHRLMGLPQAGGRAAQGFQSLLRAVAFVDRYRYAIDIGAGVGFRSWWLRRIFEGVISYEADTANYVALCENCRLAGDFPWGRWPVGLAAAASDGVIVLDEQEFLVIDFVVLTIGGATMPRLAGCEQTLKKWMPVVYVTVESEDPLSHMEMLVSWGYKVAAQTDNGLGQILVKDNG